MLEFIAGIYQHLPDGKGGYIKQMGSLTFKESQVNSASIIGLAQSAVVSLFKFTNGSPQLEEEINVEPLDHLVAEDILNHIKNKTAEIDRAFVSEEYITLVIKKNANEQRT